MSIIKTQNLPARTQLANSSAHTLSRPINLPDNIELMLDSRMYKLTHKLRVCDHKELSISNTHSSSKLEGIERISLM
jgi:hypothetical protein